MAVSTNIEWCRSTRNFWTGCTKVSPGCDNCYAEAQDKRFKGGHWGAGAPRVAHLEGAARDIRKWDRKAKAEGAFGRGEWRVFINSQSDFFDNEIPAEWREFAWSVMRECKNLTFMVLTKRIGNASSMLPLDWGAGYKNVWIGATFVNQSELNRDIMKLMAIPAKCRFASIEPMLGPIDLLIRHCEGVTQFVPAESLDLVIVGGESGSGARSMRTSWIENVLFDCQKFGTRVFVKQLGAKPLNGIGQPIKLSAKKGDQITEWDAALRVQEMPFFG